MLFSLRQLLAGRPAPLCITPDVPVREALARMIEYDYTQLPVVNQQGAYLGLLSEQRLIRISYHLGKSNVLTELKVSQCVTFSEPLSPDDDLFRALDRLEKEYAIVIVEGGKPVGILTDYDTTHFFREITEGLILIQDIELTLRQYIERAFPDEQALKEALIFTFGVDKRDERKPAKQYQELTLYEHLQLIRTEQNWPKFQTCFESKTIFSGWMEPVNVIRNQLSHFRSQVTKTQLDALQSALNWLSNCPKLPPAHEARLERLPTPVTRVAGQGAILRKQGKYDPLRDWLKNLDAKEKDVRLTFEGVERLLGEPLPPTATHRSWWANAQSGHRQSIAWLGAGWRVEEVDFSAQEVTFQRMANAGGPEEEGTL